MAGPLRDHWKRAIDEESASILLNNTFSTVNSKEAKQLLVKPVGSRWVFKTKRNPDGSTRYKTRLVIKGYEQTDFGETYTPVSKLTTFWYLIPLVGRCGWNIDNLDVVTTFPNPDVDDNDIYMVLPEGWPHKDMHAPPIIVRLRKALYGLKQTPRLWHNDINTFLLSHGFTQSQADPKLHIHSEGILILLYVDNISMMYARTESASKAAIEVKAKLSEQYKITHLGPERQLLGIKIHRDDYGISLGQKAFITTILKRFHMQDAHGVTTPMDPNVKLDLANDRGEKELDKESVKHFQVIVRSLMYAALATRPDISYAVAALCWYNSSPFTSHMTAAKRVFQYLKATADFQLHFNGNGNGNGNYGVVGFTDSDWASVSTNCKSQGGHVFLMCHDGGAISWQSRKQDLIALSTLEAEYIACSEASREGRPLLQLQWDIHGFQNQASPPSSPLPIYCDNQGALTHITTGVITARTKHIDVCYHNSRDLHTPKIVDYSYVHTNENAADILTNALTKEKHTTFTKVMG